jgi:Tol biopolymer transport system component
MNSDGSKQRLLQTAHTSNDNTGRIFTVGGAGWSPDRIRVVAGASERRGGELYTMSASGGEVRQISDGQSDDPKYAPSGRQIAVVQQANMMFPDSENYRALYVMNADGTDRRSLVANNRGAVSLGASLAWTRDGTHVVFEGLERPQSTTTSTVQPQQPEHYGLYSVALDGSDLHRLPIPGEASQPAISLDGTKVAYYGSLDGQTHGLYVANLDGSNPRLVVSGNAFGPSWSPDNTRVMFYSDVDAPPTCGTCPRLTSIYAIGADGGNRVRITTPPANQADFSPAWAT